MIRVRHAADRGRSHAGWLDSRHSFSFADYYDPAQMGFGALRVLNDDRVNAAAGFGAHSHRDMEIITYVLEGELAHKDSMGNGSTIRPGDVQRMSAGTGVTHSEWNHDKNSAVHFLQIWILPETRGTAPSYEEKHFNPEELCDTLRVIASSDARDGSVSVHQDVSLYATKLSAGKSVVHALAPGRRSWVQVARGTADLNGLALQEGDGAAVEQESELVLRTQDTAEVLVFDLA